MGYLNPQPCMNRVHKDVCEQRNSSMRSSPGPDSTRLHTSEARGGGDATRKDESWECMHTKDCLRV